MRTWNRILGVSLASAAFLALPGAAPEGFSFKDEAGKHLDVLFGGRIVARDMYEYDKSTPEKLHETYKPYLHVFDAEGKAPITKGPGGKYTHHRGIFAGWNKLGAGGKTYDRWHMKGGEQVHQKFLEQKADGTTVVFGAGSFVPAKSLQQDWIASVAGISPSATRKRYRSVSASPALISARGKAPNRP